MQCPVPSTPVPCSCRRSVLGASTLRPSEGWRQRAGRPFVVSLVLHRRGSRTSVVATALVRIDTPTYHSPYFLMSANTSHLFLATCHAAVPQGCFPGFPLAGRGSSHKLSTSRCRRQLHQTLTSCWTQSCSSTAAWCRASSAMGSNM